jgi:hypothetical protein
MSYDAIMRRVMVALALCASCTATGMARESQRWPDHRKLEEKRIADLESEIVVLRTRIESLEQTLHGQPPPEAPKPAE